MSLPDGVTTCTLTYDGNIDTFGGVADSITVEVKADRVLVHAASGKTLFNRPFAATAPTGGIVSLSVPHTDQAGFRDVQGNSFTGWSYTATITARFGNEAFVQTKTFQVATGQTTVDLDLLPSPGMVQPGVTAPTATVTSVNGQTGAVTVSDGAGLPKTFVTKTAAYTAAAGEFVLADTSTAGFTVTLPASPAVGALVAVKKTSADNNTLTIAPANGGSIDGDPTATTITKNAGVVLEHAGSNVWRIAANMSLTGPSGKDGSNGTNGILSIVQDEGVSVTQRDTLNFVGNGVTVTDSGGKTTVTVPGGSGGGGGGVATRTGGFYQALPGTVVANLAMDDGSVYVSPIFISKAVTLDRIGIRVTIGAASTTVRLGIYADDGSLRPAALVVDAGTVDASATATREITISQALAPGTYWLAASKTPGGGGIQVQGTSAAPVQISPVAVAGVASQQSSGFNTNGGNSTLPSTYAPIYDQATAPRVFVRVA